MARLDEIFYLQMGKTPSRSNSSYWNNGQYDWMSIADLGTYQKYVGATKEKISSTAVQECGMKYVPANTVIMSFKLSLGKTAITRGSVYTNEAIMAFIPTGKYTVLPDYFYHLFSAKDWTAGINRAVMGTTLNKAMLGAVSVKIPLLDEQRRIAAVLDKVSDLIAKRRQQLKKLDELVKARFVEMFGGGNFPSVKLGDILKTTSGGTPLRIRPEFYDGGTIPWLTSGEVGAGYITSTKQFITEAGLKNSSAKWIPKNSIVVAMYGATAGKVGMILLPLTTNQAVCAILPSQNFNPHFLCYAVRAKEAWMMERRTGAAQPNISQSIVRNMSLIVPPVELQNRFASFVQHVEKTKTGITHGLERLEILKKALMRRCFG